MTTIKQIDLEYRKGSSDKVYKVTLQTASPGYRVHFAYGRRGNGLTTGTKTSTPVSLDKAEDIFSKLVFEKQHKGYTITKNDSNDQFLINVLLQKEDSEFRPQLLNEIEKKDLDFYINSPVWCAQEKFDGRRKSLIMTGHTVKAVNRKGLFIPIDAKLEKDVCWSLNETTETHYILDGEDLGDTFMVFDYPKTSMSFISRYQKLESLFKDKNLESIKLVPTAWTTNEKQTLYKKLVKDNAEGIVFKDIHAMYREGRPNSGGDQLKFKFCATASVIVGQVNTGKRSVEMWVKDEQVLKFVGNVTVYPNQEIPVQNSIIEVKYLYAYKDGSLFQPVLLGQRNDLDQDDCKIEQLKYKQETI